MYHPTVIERSLAKLHDAHGISLTRYEPWQSAERTAALADALAPDGTPARSLTSEETAFIRNERMLGALDYEYWSRYSCTKLDGGGFGPLVFWESQRIALDKLAAAQLYCYDQVERSEPCDGILYIIHKARQLGMTALWRSLTLHRMTTAKHQRALAASIDEDKVQELYDRDDDILTNLPWWMRPEIGFNEKRQHITFPRLGTRLLYQVSTQGSGVGQGRQFEVGHLTECASWLNPLTIEFDYMPTIPQSPNALVGLESTANGRNNWWHEFVNRVRSGHSRRWRFLFIPWYAEKSKYRAQPPADWKPSETALLHAQKVYHTSTEFVGRQVMLTPQQLYWWETTRNEHQRGGNLNLFLSNYCATVEESFQHTTTSVFPPETLDALRLTTADPRLMEVVERSA